MPNMTICRELHDQVPDTPTLERLEDTDLSTALHHGVVLRTASRAFQLSARAVRRIPRRSLGSYGAHRISVGSDRWE